MAGDRRRRTAIPADRRIDGIPEITFEHIWSPLLGGKQGTKVRQDERNVFARTVLHGAVHRDALERSLSRVGNDVDAQARVHCAAIHAYDVEQTYAY